MNRRQKILFFLLIISCNFQTIAAFPDYKFHTLSPKGGLNYDGVFKIKQDKFGFIWTLLSDELYRFDGYTYKRYSGQIRNSDLKFLSNASVQLEEDTNGNLYLESLNGIMKYERKTETFSEIKIGRVYNMKIDPQNNMWVVTSNGLNILNLKTKTMKLVLKQNTSTGKGRMLFRSDGSNFFIISDNGVLYQFDYTKSKLKKIYIIPQSVVFTDVRIKNNTLWLLTQTDGLHEINLRKNEPVRIHYFLKGSNEPVKVRLMYIAHDKNIWIATQQGLFVYNPNNGEICKYTHSENDEFSIPNNSIWNLDEDREGNLWISTFQGGICYLNFNEMSWFKTISVQSTSFSRNTISCFVETGNKLWIGTEGSGLISYDKKNASTVTYKHNSTKNSLQMDYVKALFYDNIRNKIWIGMSGGLDCFNPESGTFEHLDSNFNLAQINRIEAERDSAIWIGFKDANSRIALIPFSSKKTVFFDFSKNRFGKFYGNFIADFCRDVNNDLWIASPERLHRFNFSTKKIQAVKINNKTNVDIENIGVQTLYLDKRTKTLWIGTNGNGLLQFDIEKGNLKQFNEISQLNVHSIVSISIDSHSNLWLGTDNGLFKFNTQENKFFRFVKKDGIQGNVFYPRSCLKSITGEMFFGGTEGFTVFLPDEILLNKPETKILFTDIFVDNKSVVPNASNSPLSESLASENEIVFDFNQRNFGFEFSTTNYLIPEKTRFKYRLTGYDKDWIEVDASRRYVTYTKVPPGNYTFDVLATNADGAWMSKCQTLQIHVLTSIWLSWWAILLYLIIFIAVSYYSIRYYWKQKQMKMYLHLKSMEINKKEEIQQAQLQFYTYISHDFKTPLSLILGTIERMKEQLTTIPQKYIQSLDSNSKRLLNLINELMDFRMVEDKVMPLRVSQESIFTFVSKQTIDFIDYAKSKELHFELIIDQMEELQWFDKQILEKVILNLINNSFKYTKSGLISLHLQSGETPYQSCYTSTFKVGEPITTDFVRLVFKDSGIGISSDSISKVFDSFFMVDDPMRMRHLGSGIGLALVKNLVLLHHGNIEISSEREKGTCIAVCIPVSREAYTTTEIENESDVNKFSSNKNYIIYNTNDTIINADNEQVSEFLLREKKQILIVEDNDELRTLLVDSMSELYAICEAKDGVEALKILKENEIDLIISDIMMPNKDGYELCIEVKDTTETSHIPFVMITAKSGIDNHLLGLNSGADVYIEKPVNIKLLKKSIQNLFIQQNKVKEYYSRHHFSDNPETKINQKENDFIRKLMDVIDKKLDQPELDITYITQEMMMSRTKLYSKLKTLTGKSIVEFVRYYKMRKAARMLLDENMTMKEVMDAVGIETPSYFTRVFKQEFGETPTSFIANAKKRQ